MLDGSSLPFLCSVFSKLRVLVRTLRIQCCCNDTLLWDRFGGGAFILGVNANDEELVLAVVDPMFVKNLARTRQVTTDGTRANRNDTWSETFRDNQS